MTKYGDCPLCHLLCRLRKDGTVGRHYLGTALWRDPRGDGIRCEGEGREPAPHLPANTPAEMSVPRVVQT